MILKSDELIQEFYDSNKENLPELTLEQYKDICHGPWRFLKKEMASGELPTIRFKYFGSFQVYKGRASYALMGLKGKLNLNKITLEDYKYYKVMLTKHLNRF